MQKPVLQTIEKLKPLPFFKQGTLVFDKSGHELRISDRHYRCDLDCRGKCDMREPQLKKESVERNFVTLLSHFEKDGDTIEEVMDMLMRENIADILLGPEKQARNAREMMEATYAVAMQEAVKKGRVSRSDLNDHANALIQEKQANYSTILAGMVFDVLRSICEDVPEKTERAKTFARIVRHLYVSDKGKIQKIEFEPWGWYVMQLFDKNIPNYLHGVRQHIKIVNSPDALSGKKLSDAAMFFATEMQGDALGQNVTVVSDWIRVLKDMMQALHKHDTAGAGQIMQLAVQRMMQSHHILGALGVLAPALEQKPRLSKVDKITNADA